MLKYDYFMKLALNEAKKCSQKKEIPVGAIIVDEFKNIISKNKYGKYLAIGGFAFFFIKGLIWLAVIFSVGFSAFNFI